MDNASLFAPPSQEELDELERKSQDDLFAPPTEEELQTVSVAKEEQADLFAPPTAEELGTQEPAKPEPGFFTNIAVTPEEIKEKAAKFKIPEEDVARAVQLYGGRVAGQDEIKDIAREALGMVSESLGGLPTFALKKLVGMIEGGEAEKALDEINQMVNERKSTAQDIGEFALGAAVPTATATKGLGKVATAVVGGTEAAAFGLGESKKGEELESAATSFALGAAVPPIIMGTVQLAKKAGTSVAKLVKPSEKAVQDLQQLASAKVADNKQADDLFFDMLAKPKEERNYLEWAKSTGKNITDPKKAEDLFNKQMGQFATGLERPGQSSVGKGALLRNPEAAEAIITREKAIRQPEVWTTLQDEFRLKKAIDSGIVSKLEKQTNLRNSDSLLRKGKLWLEDGYYVMRDIANKFKLPADVVSDMATQADNLARQDMLKALEDVTVPVANEAGEVVTKSIKGLNTLEKEFKATGMDADTLYDALNGTLKRELTPEQTKYVSEFREYTDYMREYANSIGANISKREDWIFHKRVSLVDTIMRISKEADRLADYGIGQLKPKDFMSLRSSNKEVDDLVRALELMEGKAIRNANEFNTAFVLSQNPVTAGKKFGMDIGTALERKDGIPEFLLERDPFKLMTNWAADTFRSTRMQKPLSEFRNIRNVLEKAGHKDYAQYMDALISDISGARGGTVAASAQRLKLQSQLNFKRKAEETTNPVYRFTYNLLAEAPEISNVIFNQVYPNFLGLSPRAVIMNLTQPFFMTMPELGYGYGARKLFSAYGKLLTGDWTSVVNRLKAQGGLPASYNTELDRIVNRGMVTNPILKGTKQFAETYSKVAMSMFEASERINRVTSHILSQDIAKDLINGNAAGLKFLDKLTPTYKNAINKALKEGNADQVEELVSRYVTSKTLFNYNRITMNKFGREMGPLFSVFSKWPASVAGQVIESYERKGIIGGTTELSQRYLAPLAFMSAVSSLMFDELASSELGKNDAKTLEQLMTGKNAELYTKEGPGLVRGFAKATPLGSVDAILSGKVFSPPAVALIRDPAVAILKGDKNKLENWAANTVGGFVPGLGIISFANETLPAVLDAFDVVGTQDLQPYKPKREKK